MRIVARCVLGAAVLCLLIAGTARATFPGQNGRISWDRFNDDPFTINVWTSRSDGSDQRLASPFGPDVFTGFSDWSPDGRRLSMISGTDPEPPQVVVANSDGTGRRQITAASGGAFDAAWTPDGRWLAIDADFDGAQGIFLVPAWSAAPVTAAQARTVTHNTEGGFDSEPQPSPDGRWIVFTRFGVGCTEGPDNCVTTIFRVRTDGSRLQRVVEPSYNASNPDYHPSGELIAFDTHDNSVAPNAGHIMVSRPDGSGKRIVLRGDDDDFFNNPAFSPDGRQIVLARWDARLSDSQPAIWVAGANGARPHQVVAAPANKPDWGAAPRGRDDRHGHGNHHGDHDDDYDEHRGD
jgi:Tol biopolymer transport system component